MRLKLTVPLGRLLYTTTLIFLILIIIIIMPNIRLKHMRMEEENWRLDVLCARLTLLILYYYLIYNMADILTFSKNINIIVYLCPL